MDFVKLKDVDNFTITKFVKKFWRMWNSQTNRYEMSDSWQQGYEKRYRFETNKGLLDLSQNQLGQLLTNAFDWGMKLEGTTFSVKNNGKQGMEIRYYFNVVKDAPQPIPQEECSQEPPVNDDYYNQSVPQEGDEDIPF